MIFDTAFQRTAYNCGDQIEANVNLLHAITEHVHLTPLAPSTRHFDSQLWRRSERRNSNGDLWTMRMLIYQHAH
jgi:hypothetical protein